MGRWAEDEIIIPTGPHANRRFRLDRQPYSRHLYAAIDSGWWYRFAITGPSQSGKTLQAFVIPTLYHLFEQRETVILGLPSMDMANDKWREDLLPAIEKSRYRDLLPLHGEGSKGGRVRSAVTFRNGATLKLMSAGGDDQSRAAFTARVLVCTEANRLGKSSSTSSESTPLRQLEARTNAFGSRRRIYLECTVDTEDGVIWSEYSGGTASRLALPCPYCGVYVSPEREHLAGHHGAEHEMAARDNARFTCPACGHDWLEDDENKDNGDRRKANNAAVLVHRGQEIDAAGNVTGPLPPTTTLGFRWSGVNNMLLKAADFAAAEFKASQRQDEDDAEKEMCQFWWATPPKLVSEEQVKLEAHSVQRRVGPYARGEFPGEAAFIGVGVDVSKRYLNFVGVADGENGSGWVPEYGLVEVPGDSLTVEKAVPIALAELADKISEWGVEPDLIFVDAGYATDQVYEFCRKRGGPWMPCVGRGVGQQYEKRYDRPKNTGSIVTFIGQEYHVSRLRHGLKLVEFNADSWKTTIHERFSIPTAHDGSLVLFDAEPKEHLAYAKHVTNEQKVTELTERGYVTRWTNKAKKANHYFDATGMGCVAAHYARARTDKPKAAPGSWFNKSKKRGAKNG